MDYVNGEEYLGRWKYRSETLF